MRRPTVEALLDEGRGRRLTLVVAAPGTGKTTAVAGWVGTRRPGTTAWLTCDRNDRSPTRFVHALVESMARGFAEVHLGAGARQLLDVDGAESIDAFAALGHDLERLSGPRVLVVDDFHLLHRDSAEAFVELLDCAPPSLQIVIASRTEPQLRLHRMRAHQELVEVTDADLALTVDETAELLAGLGLSLDPADVAALHERTEGWAAGIQMAVTTDEATPDPLAGYVLEEVLLRQSGAVVEFLLATSVLDELTADACSALCGEGAPALLDEVRAAHLFVTPAAGGRGASRYHGLVKEVLHAELRRRSPQREVELHRAASRHFLDSAHAGLAARHLLSAGDLDEAFALLGEHMARDLLTQPTMASALDIDELRPELFAGQAHILVPLASELLWRGPFESGIRAARLAQQCVINADQDPTLALRMEVVNVVSHTMVGEYEEALRHREVARSLATSAEGAEDWLAAVDATAMFCFAQLQDVETTRQLAEELSTKARSVAHIDVVGGGLLSQATLIEGDLEQAELLAHRGLDAAQRLAFGRHFFAFPSLLTASQVALERRELIVATDLVDRALTIARRGRPHFLYLAQLQQARIWAAEGDPEAALASIPGTRDALQSTKAAALADADELEARLRARLGDQVGASGLTSRLRRPRRQITQAVIALASGEPKRAEEALGELPDAPSTTRIAVEAELLRAAVAVTLGSVGAERTVRHALETAQRHGFLQTVLDTAPQLVDHLAEHPDRYPASEHLLGYVVALLESDGSGRRRGPVDPLTDAELRVLRKLADHMSYADIATELYVSTNTVKTHLRHVYMKLGVSTRSSAIARASALGLV